MSNLGTNHKKNVNPHNIKIHKELPIRENNRKTQNLEKEKIALRDLKRIS